MVFELVFTPQAEEDLTELEQEGGLAAQLKAVRKCLGLMETNLRHPGLNTHELKGKRGPDGEKVWEAYAQNQTPSAYRVIWYYGPGSRQITIAAIVPHL